MLTYKLNIIGLFYLDYYQSIRDRNTKKYEHFILKVCHVYTYL